MIAKLGMAVITAATSFKLVSDSALQRTSMWRSLRR